MSVFLGFVEHGLVLGGERDRELPKRRGAVRAGERSDDQPLIHVAHGHAVLDEVDQLIKRHGITLPADRPRAQLAAQRGESRP